VPARGLGWRAIAALAAGLLLACARATAADAVAESLRLRTEQLRGAQEVRVAGAPIAARRLIAEFYAQRGFHPAWTRAGQAEALRELVAASRSHGLDPADYHAAALAALADGAQPVAPGDPGRAADRELLLTDALVRLAYHFRFGKVNPRELYPDWNFTRALGAIDPVRAIDAAIASDDLHAAVESYAPQLEAYARLRDALARHRAIAAAGGWPTVPAGPALEVGARDARVAVLRARLAASGDADPGVPSDPDHFDEALAAGVRRFQARHGLEPDGVVGRRTRGALAVDVERRIDQIRVNLERLRWVAQDLAGDYLIVDIAGFSARLYLGGRLAWSSRIVVGRPFRETPAFRATLRWVVFNPTWTVPPTILKEDLLPRLIEDPGYLERNRMTVLDRSGQPIDAARLDWRQYASHPFPYRIVQAPGGGNPLGGLEFVLPNPHAVFLHDTPVRSLFAKPERAFSSGCIRLERALELAVLVLDDPERWSAAAIGAAIGAGERRTVPVKHRVPVMLLYFSAAADADGVMRFHPDLYGRDPGVLVALGAPFRFSPVAGARPRATPIPSGGKR
jgi:murein L,D-transpeptidase YcbB/YkuD